MVPVLILTLDRYTGMVYGTCINPDFRQVHRYMVPVLILVLVVG